MGAKLCKKSDKRTTTEQSGVSRREGDPAYQAYPQGHVSRNDPTPPSAENVSQDNQRIDRAVVMCRHFELEGDLDIQVYLEAQKRGPQPEGHREDILGVTVHWCQEIIRHLGGDAPPFKDFQFDKVANPPGNVAPVRPGNPQPPRPPPEPRA